MKNDNFAAFILTHGRPDNVRTYSALKRSGYTGKIYLIVDDEDTTLPEYEKKYGKQVIIFSKDEISKTFDQADNFTDRRSIVYARNACFDIAKGLGIRYFIQLDDDYSSFSYKFDNNLEQKERGIKQLDKVFDALVDYYKNIPALTIAMAQGGDFLGGDKGRFKKNLHLMRKAMNSFICDTTRPFKFIGRINEDVNTYVRLGSVGELFLTVPNVKISQQTTQKNKGGMTELYLDSGTYIKSFYTVMVHPSSVKISEMGEKNRRIHHHIQWNNTVPRIIEEKYKKI
jgi:hypothetical protein